MNLIKKSTRPFAAGLSGGAEIFPVVLEPKPGCTPVELEKAAREVAARDLEWLSEGMLSAMIDQSAAERLSKVAHVTRKQVKQPRGQ